MNHLDWKLCEMSIELADVVTWNDNVVTNVHEVDEELSGARGLTEERNNLNDNLTKGSVF